MRIRLASLVVVMAMTLSPGGTSVFAHAVSDPNTPTGETKTSSTSTPVVKDEAKPDDKLRGDLRQLVADAKAGKVAPRKSQFPNTKRNNLSTGAKIGIAAGIAGAVILIWVFHELSKD